MFKCYKTTLVHNSSLRAFQQYQLHEGEGEAALWYGRSQCDTKNKQLWIDMFQV